MVQMDEYVNLPAQRLAHLVRKYVHHCRMKEIEGKPLSWFCLWQCHTSIQNEVHFMNFKFSKRIFVCTSTDDG